MRQISKILFLFAVGGAAYYSIELVCRGRSHPSMFLLGGICFVLCGGLNELFPEDIPLWQQMFVCSLMITLLELIFGYVINILKFIYMLVCTLAFIIAFTRLTSALSTLIPDVVQLLSVLMQLFFWFTPIIWNLSMLEGVPNILKLAKCMPFTYLVSGFREVFIHGNMLTESYGIYTIAFWAITIILYIWGNYVFNKSKKDFADVL